MDTPFNPPLPTSAQQPRRWINLNDTALALALHQSLRAEKRLLVMLTDSMNQANRLRESVQFFRADNDYPLHIFPDWEILPYDHFSPHQDIVSTRLESLYRLPLQQQGLLIVPIATLMQRVAPRDFLEQQVFMLSVNDELSLTALCQKLEYGGYQRTTQVMEHGEFAVRGELLDLFPMGSSQPYRIDFLDDAVDSIRLFDPDSQRSQGKINDIRLLPAHEFPFDEDAINRFRKAFRQQFPELAKNSSIYRDVSAAIPPAGIEYYLPLFFEHTATLFDYLPDDALLFMTPAAENTAQQVWQEIQERYKQQTHDKNRPLLEPKQLFLQPQEIFSQCKAYRRVLLREDNAEKTSSGNRFAQLEVPDLAIAPQKQHPLEKFTRFLHDWEGQLLLVAETTGRRENLLELLQPLKIKPTLTPHWQQFMADQLSLGLTVANLEQPLYLAQPPLLILPESCILGEQVEQHRRRKKSVHDSFESSIQNLDALEINAPVVHANHGIGRYQGLKVLDMDGIQQEFLVMTYAAGDTLYVPVAQIELISRYSGHNADNAPLNRLGSEQWQKAKQKAREKIHDVATELLEIHAKREHATGHAFRLSDSQYQTFIRAFPFEETPDQKTVSEQVQLDMISPRVMDRLVCGDVGFGKTEIAMRAAFIAAMDGSQVAILVPTTLLAEQHFETIRDRFADWPVKVAVLSRFGGSKKQALVLQQLANGDIDVVVGTYKLLQKDVQFKRLGLLIVDEEHRFGVRQKERMKALRAEVDMLTLTATPIPRTLNMAMHDIRDLSIMTTPPAKRLSIKTFVRDWDKALIREACLREIHRGGQVYFLHNSVETMDNMVDDLSQLLPEAVIQSAHGQMPEKRLEKIMRDFHHQRFHILLCTTIIESGIDVPTANTIIINRADKLGMAQLHQLRGRVGRSHHQAFAYLLIPDSKSISNDAKKRLDAIASLEDLGVGFSLASHDLEIRGAGEFLGEEQSGQIQAIGFSLYRELLEDTLKSLKSGQLLDKEAPTHQQTEIDLHIPALIPDDYLADIHSRLILYKRIAHADNTQELNALKVEMVDRFGLLPDAVKQLFAVTQLKITANPLGIVKIDGNLQGVRVRFTEKPQISPDKILNLIQFQHEHYKLAGPNTLKHLFSAKDGGDCLHKVATLLHTLSQ